MKDGQMRLTLALTTWGTGKFETTLKRELAALQEGVLPLQQGLRASSHAGEVEEVVILDVSEARDDIRVKAGIFYTGTTPGCSCADDPSPLDQAAEYCELLLRIDKRTAATNVVLLDSTPTSGY